MNISKTYIFKLRYIIPDFVAISFGSVLVLGFIRWFFFLEYPILEIKEEVWHFWIPVIFPWIPNYFWFRRKFRILTFKKDIEKRRFSFQVIIWLVMGITLIFSQHYLTTTTGKLLTVKNVKEIQKHKRVRYYRVTDFAVHKFIGGVQSHFRISGKWNSDLNITIYFVNPILTHKTQHIVTTPPYWYGVKFHKRISNLGSNAKKEKKYQAFFKECVAKMEKYDYYKLDHFECKPASVDRENFRIAIQFATRAKVKNDVMILEPVSGAYEQRDGYKLAWMFGLFGIGLVILMLTLIKPALSEAEEVNAVPDFSGTNEN
jgi:rhomboid protease GluP